MLNYDANEKKCHLIMNRSRTLPSLISIRTDKALLSTSADDMYLGTKRGRLRFFGATSHQSEVFTSQLIQDLRLGKPPSKPKRVRRSSDPFPVSNTPEMNTTLPSSTIPELYSSTIVKDTVFRLPGYRFRNLQYKGEGSYGVVVSAFDCKTKTSVAIKRLQPFGHDVHTKRVWREIYILRNLGAHENIIDIQSLICVPTNQENLREIYVVQTLMKWDLFYLLNKQHLTEDHIRYFVYQILRGLKYIHSANVLHRDLKPSNLLINENCDLRICDFSMSRYPFWCSK